MRIVVVGPKITPPWDSAAASLGRGLLQALSHLGSQIFVVTTRVPLRRILWNYGFVSNGIKDFEGLRGGDAGIEWCVIKHRSDELYVETKLAMFASSIARRVGVDAIFYVGFPRNPFVIHLISGSCDVVMLYTYTIPSMEYLSLLKHYLINIKKSKLLVCTTSVIAYNVIKKCLSASQVYVLPPVVDTHIFKPVSKASDSSRNCLHIGYVGPVHAPRFPINDIAKALALLRSKGINVSLHVRSVLRHGRRDWPYVHIIKKLFEKILGSENVDVRIGQLSRKDLNEFYNSIDVLLYVFTLYREAEVADPPLVPLEALSAGTPLVFSLGSSLDYYLKPLIEMGVVKPVVRGQTSSIAKAVYELSSLDEKNRNVVHGYIDRVFSPRSVSLRIKEILEEIL